MAGGLADALSLMTTSTTSLNILLTTSELLLTDISLSITSIISCATSAVSSLLTILWLASSIIASTTSTTSGFLDWSREILLGTA